MAFCVYPKFIIINEGEPNEVIGLAGQLIRFSPIGYYITAYMSKKITIAMLGCGTVGSGLIKLLAHYHHEKREPEIVLKKILVRNMQRASDISSKHGLEKHLFTDDVTDIINDPEIQIVVEVMGGVERTKKILLDAITNKKHIVTANKDLLALEGEDLFEASKTAGVSIMFEAAVAGGIPVISTLKQSLQGNHIEQVMGIINGTTNYILDVMKTENRSFDEVLKRAQELGFAESDPVNDIEGHDAAYKTAILASIISGKRVDVNKVYREGITKISQMDIKSADKRGYEIKLLGIVNNGEKLDARVHPVFVRKSNPLASVRMENNAIFIKGNAVQELTLIGKGAGSLPTASSVFGDVLIIASQLSTGIPNSQFACKHNEYAELMDIKDVKNSFYVRISMTDKVGVLKDLGAILADNQANVKFIDQYDVHGEEAHADFIVDPIKESLMDQIIKEIGQLDSIKAIESVIRVIQ